MATQPIVKVVDDIVKSAEDKRFYRGLELGNGLKVLLVSDPTTDKSAAALDVHIGHMSDPSNLPGLAHFCEHMLFLGTEKYPSENEYTKFLSQSGGSSNAFTAADHTNYYFDVSPEHLEGALDRFAQFFVGPLFTESASSREVNAVNSEHEKNIQNDIWRLNQLDKSTSDPEHDYSKFATGNKETLEIIPKSKGVNVRDELLAFHEKWYSANVMGLAVLGKESLDDLSKMVVSLFSNVRNKNVKIPEWITHPFREQELKMRYYVVPVQDIRIMNITFPIPDLQPHYRSSPGHYLGHLIGHEGPGSLLSELKSRGWVNSLVGGYKSGAKGFAFFIVNMSLTEEGIEHVEQIVFLLFQYLTMLREEGIQTWVFEECQNLAAMTFRFKDRERPQMYSCALSGMLHDYPVVEVLSGPYLMHEYQPDLIKDLLNRLRPENIRLAVIGKKFQSITDSTESWYGTPYKMEPIPEEDLKAWAEAGLHPKLKLPPKNEFIPTNFELCPREPEYAAQPVLIKNTENIRAWFMQDNEFNLPKAVLNFEFESPLAYLDPQHCNMAYIFVQLFKDSLNEYTYAAELAGLSYSLNNTKYGMFLTVKGYNDKQHVLLQKIMEKLTSFQIDRKRFEILKEAYIRSLKNFEAEQPHQHATYYSAMLLSEKVWSNTELLAATDELTMERVQSLIPKLLSKMHITAFIHGNISKEQAINITMLMETQLEENLKWLPLLPSQLIRYRQYELSPMYQYIFKKTNAIHKSSCVEAYYQCGLQETRENMLLELFSQAMTEPCFNVLRTQEQLGYIVSSGPRRANGVQGLRIIVQSDRSPEFLDTRIEAFIKHFGNHLSEMSSQDFEAHKSTLAARRLERPKKLVLLSLKYWEEIVSQQYNFDRDNVEVECLKGITKEDIQQFYKELIAADGLKRRKISIQIVSTAEGGAGNQGTNQDVINEEKLQHLDSLAISSHGAMPVFIENVTDFKRTLALYPLVKSCIVIPPPNPNNAPSPTKAKL